MSYHEQYRQWPFLTLDEFEEVCTYFDQRYVRAHLGPTRQVFKIRQRRLATTGSSYIEIQRLLKLPDDDEELIAAFGKMNRLQENSIEQDVHMVDEEADYEALNNPHSSESRPPLYSEHPHQPYVKYEIHLHPTYQTPCLWFELKDLPMGESSMNLDAVYRYLVPDCEKSRLRGLGVSGGISFDHHPVSQLPSFFIHPCMTKEAMEAFSCSKDQYLMCWLGLVGPSVGLWLPLDMQLGSIFVWVITYPTLIDAIIETSRVLTLHTYYEVDDTLFDAFKTLNVAR